jgi:hypothetical protein
VESSRARSGPISRGSLSGLTWEHVSETGLRLEEGSTHNLDDFALAVRADQARLVAIPLVSAGMAVDNLAVASGIEMTLVGVGALRLIAGSHGSCRLTALVRSEGT